MSKKWLAWAGVAAAGIFVVASLGLALGVNAQGRLDLPGRAAPIAGQEHTHVIDVSDAEPLTQAEIDGLLYMREEEKLARDVYMALYDKWGQSVFNTIASSEAKHMDSALDLIVAYGLEDPVAGKAAGEFVNADLQALYDELVAQGSTSLVDALRVGAAIEEIDILDLRAHLAETEQTAITDVYTNLERASQNHLRAFVKQIERQSGADYEPQYMTAEDSAEILAASNAGNGMNQGLSQGESQGQCMGRDQQAESQGRGQGRRGR